MRFLCSACRTILTGDPGQEVECRLCKTMCKVPAEPTAAGAVIGDFAIVRELARGGMGVVYLARQISLDRLVALKILQEKYASDAQFVEDFIREARAAARISHPNIVQAYAVGEENGIYYFAMELIDGDTMKSVLKKEQKIEPRKAAEVIRSIADALDYAWTEQKIVHQDIKPDNIMLTRRGQAKLADLGLSRVATGSMDLDDDDEVMGTPQYISPEQLTGKPTDIRSDIYSLGATFYHLVTGEFPYKGKDGNEIARQHVEGTLIPPIEKIPDLPQELNRIIIKMMAKSIEERYQSGADLVNDLRNFLQGTATPAPAKDAKPATVKPQTVPAPKLNQSAAPALNAAPAPKLNQTAAPKVSTPEAPKVNTPAAPKVNAPAVPKVNAPAVPKVNAPAVPKVNAPATPKVNAPAVPKVNAPAVPKVAAPATPKPETPAKPVAPVAPKKEEASKEASGNGLKLQKKEDDKSESSAPPIVQQLQEDQKKKKGLALPKWVTLTISGVVGVIALTIITLAVLIYFRQMPQFMKPVEEQIFSIMNLAEQDGKLVRVTSASQAPAATVKPKPTAAHAAPKPQEPPKPATRQDFVQAQQALLRLADQGNTTEFLDGTDEFIQKYPNDQTPEEKALRLKLLQAYGPNDEILRVSEYRNQAHAKREEAQLAAAEAAEAQAEAERKRKAEAERIAAEQKSKMEQAVREAAENRAEALARLKPRIDAYIARKKIDCQTLAGAFFTELGIAGSARWQACRTAAMDAGTFPPDVQQAEKTAAQNAARFARSLDTDYAMAGALKNALADQEVLHQVQLEVKQQLTRLERFEKPHHAIVRNTLTDKLFSLDLHRPRTRNAVLTRMLNKKQIGAIYAKIPEKQKLPLFSEHFDLVTGDYEHLLSTASPARKQFFSILLQGYFADRMQNGTAEEKAMLEKSCGKMQEFLKATGK